MEFVAADYNFLVNAPSSEIGKSYKVIVKADNFGL